MTSRVNSPTDPSIPVPFQVRWSCYFVHLALGLATLAVMLGGYAYERATGRPAIMGTRHSLTQGATQKRAQSSASFVECSVGLLEMPLEIWLAHGRDSRAQISETDRQT